MERVQVSGHPAVVPFLFPPRKASLSACWVAWMRAEGGKAKGEEQRIGLGAVMSNG